MNMTKNSILVRLKEIFEEDLFSYSFNDNRTFLFLSIKKAYPSKVSKLIKLDIPFGFVPSEFDPTSIKLIIDLLHIEEDNILNP